VLLSDARRESSRALVGHVERADVPAAASVPAELDGPVLEPLLEAGFVPEPLSEPLMWLDSPPGTAAGSFVVRRVRTDDELSRAIEAAADGHGSDAPMLSRALARPVRADEDVTTWIAWSGEDAASVAWLTCGTRLGVWQMNTPPRHRRRGAARETLIAALVELWSDDTEGAFLWASPAGRPLYERIGFQVVEERRVLVRGGDEAASIAVGQPR
jgi:hypothetical protein